MTTEATVTKPNTVHATLSNRDVLMLYSFIYSATAPNAGISQTFDKLLDRFTALGVAVVDGQNGQTQFVATQLPENVQFDFTKSELLALKYVMAQRLHPSSQNKAQVSHGTARTALWPLAKELGIYTALHKELYPEGKNEEADIEIDAEKTQEPTEQCQN